jgi:two-component system, NtrC family, nitrogen regulation sensor histidine kinase NtrY
MPEIETILVSPDAARDRKRRQREMQLALAGFLAVAALTWAALRYLGVNTALFLGLIFFLFLLLLLILFVVARNMLKLLVERKRKVLGAHLRTRLVVAFMALSLAPTALMFVVGVRFVQTSVDYWFKSQVDNSLQQALEVGQAFYGSAQERLERRGRHVLERIREARYVWGGKGMDEFIETKRHEYDLSLFGVLGPDHREQGWHMDPEWAKAWPEAKAAAPWDSLSESPEFWSTILPGPAADLVLGVLPVDNGRTGYLVLGENLGRGLLFKLEQIVTGVEEYKKLRTMKYPLKVALYMFLGVVSLLVIFGSLWFGFRMAKEISSPVLALAQGAQRIAKGDLSVRLVDESTDELGFLVQNFNQMAEDLQKGRDDLTQAYDRLNSSHGELAVRGRYIQTLLDNITAGVVSLNAAGRVVAVNRAAEALLGLDAATALGRTPGELERGDFSSFLEEAAQRLAQGGAGSMQRQVEMQAEGRTVKLLVNAVPFRSGEGVELRSGLVAVCEDITELEKMQRVAAWKEVARRIAHEIKNPLTPIKLSAQRLERKFSAQVEDPAFAECITLIVRQVEHLQRMVADFSTFAKLPEAELRLDNLLPLLVETVELFRHSHSHIRWELEAPGDLPALRLDRDGVRRVFMNLFTNAAEALRDQPRGLVRVEAGVDPALGLVRVEVADNGPGLTPEERSRMFEPYFSRKKGGAGLGLAIVKSVVNDHLGQVSTRPNPPRGTVMVVELPLPAGPPPA